MDIINSIYIYTLIYFLYIIIQQHTAAAAAVAAAVAAAAPRPAWSGAHLPLRNLLPLFEIRTLYNKINYSLRKYNFLSKIRFVLRNLVIYFEITICSFNDVIYSKFFCFRRKYEILYQKYDFPRMYATNYVPGTSIRTGPGRGGAMCSQAWGALGSNILIYIHIYIFLFG